MKKYIMYGKHPVFAALANTNRKIHEVCCLEKYELQINDIINNTNNSKIKIQIKEPSFFKNKLGEDLSHQGIYATVEPLKIFHENELITNNIDRLIILDQITDTHNLGAIIRSAAAFGPANLIVTDISTPHENATIAKASSGCLELVKIARVTNLAGSIQNLKKKGFWVAGLSKNGPNSFNEIKDIDKLAIIIGSEGKGMRNLTAKLCDFQVGININPDVESLNASVAAAIALHSTQKR